ncbi:MAG: LysR family transcriptional regulator [Bacteriovoracia bacterium]
MSLSSLQLDAFQAVAAAKTFSAAAKALHLTQSALSQRVMNLEEELGSTLFIRESSGLRLTDLGEKLLRYCRSRSLLEEEFLGATKSKGLSGAVRIAGFSTVVRSLLVPITASLVKDHPDLQISLQSAELRELPGLLASGAADYVLLTRVPEKSGIESQLLGHEENVWVTGKGKHARTGVFLDHDAEDATTEEFFRLQGKKSPKYKRSYLGDMYTILEGVRAGLGSAIAPLHIAKEIPGLEIEKGYKNLRVPVYLAYHASGFPTKLQKEVVTRLQREVPLLLG